jgi:hypothetical protein
MKRERNKGERKEKEGRKTNRNQRQRKRTESIQGRTEDKNRVSMSICILLGYVSY